MKRKELKDCLQLQLNTCRKHELPDLEPEDMVAVALSTVGKMPVYGTRTALPETGNISWFFHCGEYSDADDFYQPVHTEQLTEILPLAIKYLRLPYGSKFIIDDNGYEDVWLIQ